MIITLVVIYCMTLNQYSCRVMEMVPHDYRVITSITDCLQGGLIGSMTFTMDHADWTVKGVRCEEHETGAQFSKQLKERIND